MIVGISMVRNEAGIIGSTIRHLMAEGVDHFLVYDGSSTDGTLDILAELPVTVTEDPDRGFYQARKMTALAVQAFELGAEWVVPFDADEFIYPTDGTSIAEVLASAAADKLYVRMILQRDWDHREPGHKSLPKVVFRASRHATLDFGQHDVRGTVGDERDRLELRELQYRNWDHFVAKVENARRLFADTPDMDPMHGTHMRRLAAMTHEELVAEWDTLQSPTVVFDPIPSKLAPEHRPCR